MSDEKRKVLDCRTYPSEKDCTLSSKEEKKKCSRPPLNMRSRPTGIRTVRNCASSFEHL